METLIIFLNIHSIDYDIITNVFNIWNVTNARGNHIVKLLSVNTKTKTFISK